MNQFTPVKQMEWTGERLVTDPSLGKGIIEHLHRYSICLKLVEGKTVLDIASGEGYGTNLLAHYAAHVQGVDISTEAIAHAKQKYAKPNVAFKEGSATKIPCPSHSLDVVVSFETIEHHDQHEAMMLEVKRVLKNDGILIISTPERDNYRKVDPDNPHHVKELTGLEFNMLLNKHFLTIEMYHQHYVHGSFITPALGKVGNELLEYNGNFEAVQEAQFGNNNIYNIAICSNGNLPFSVNQSIFNGAENLQLFYSTIMENHSHQVKQAVYNTKAYKLGRLLLRPLSFMKKYFKQ